MEVYRFFMPLTKKKMEANSKFRLPEVQVSQAFALTFSKLRNLAFNGIFASFDR